MLVEAILRATARTLPHLRRRGLVSDAVALWSRATRRRQSWKPHEARCQAFVAAMTGDLATAGTAVILGSGLIRDVPLAALTSSFRRVVLVDAVHLLPSRLRARRFGCELVLADLSTPAASCTPLAGLRSDGVDLVVSANLLSQLVVAALRPVEDRRSDEAVAIRRRVVHAHLADLEWFDAPACLLTDVGYRDVAPDGAVLDGVEIVDADLMPVPDDTWTWDVAPRGEISLRFARRHEVGAWRLEAGKVRLASAES